MAQADENLIYYNIDVKNETQERIIPSFNINRVQAVLDDPSEYEMAIVRFSLPLTSIPLFLFKNDIFKVSLKIGASEYTESIVWIPNNNVYDDKNVYEIQHLLNMINTAWALAFTTLKSANTVASTTPPFMTHSSLTNLITLFVPQTYLTDNIDVYTNSNMHRRLHSFYDFYNEFVSVGELNTFNSNGFFQFFPEGPLRYIDLLSTEPMKRIDLEIKWTTKDRQTETYYLQPNEQLSMKILFRKKQNLILDDFISEQIHDKIKSE